jgi:vacuolar-type H+-ATPase subunit H
MSDVSTLEKIKESEDLYSKEIAKAKAEAESIIKKAHAEAEIIMHDEHERALEQADVMRVEAVKESKKRFDEVIEAQKAKVSLFKSVPNEEVLESFSEAVSESFEL